MRKTRIVRRAGVLGATAIATMLSMFVYAPAANAATALRTGAFGSYSTCYLRVYQKTRAYEDDSSVRVGACFKYGPGAAGWYFYTYYN